MPFGLFQMKRKLYLKISILIVAADLRLHPNDRLNTIQRRQENSRHRRAYDIPTVCIVTGMSACFKAYQMTFVFEKGYFNHSLSKTICQPWISR